MRLSQLIQQLQEIASRLDTDLEVYQAVSFRLLPIGEVCYVDARSLRPDNSGPRQVYLHLSPEEPSRR